MSSCLADGDSLNPACVASRRQPARRQAFASRNADTAVTSFMYGRLTAPGQSGGRNAGAAGCRLTVREVTAT
jgi:hypothetical protein